MTSALHQSCIARILKGASFGVRNWVTGLGTITSRFSFLEVEYGCRRVNCAENDAVVYRNQYADVGIELDRIRGEPLMGVLSVDGSYGQDLLDLGELAARTLPELDKELKGYFLDGSAGGRNRDRVLDIYAVPIRQLAHDVLSGTDATAPSV